MVPLRVQGEYSRLNRPSDLVSIAQAEGQIRSIPVRASQLAEGDALTALAIIEHHPDLAQSARHPADVHNRNVKGPMASPGISLLADYHPDAWT